VQDFTEFLKTYRLDALPASFERFFLNDILHMTEGDIDTLDPYEYQKALIYATFTHRSRNMLVDPKNTKGQHTDETIHFKQPADFGRDPKFVSRVAQ